MENHERPGLAPGTVRLACLARRIEARAAADLDAHHILGASVLIAQAGRVLYRRHFGWVSPDREERVSDRTLFRLASMTKPITAAATVLLSQQGRLSLDDPVARYSPEFSRLRVAAGEGRSIENPVPITLRHLLTHTSGIASGAVWTEACAEMSSDDRESVERLVSFLSTRPLSFVPGTRQEYSGVGAYSLLTDILQKVTDEDYEQWLQRELLIPLEMKDTTFAPSPEQWGRLIEMHDRRDGQSVASPTPEGCVFENYPAKSYLGGAGLISSIDDYFRFAELLRTGKTPKGVRLLSEAACREIRTPQLTAQVHPGNQRWGLGVRVIVDAQYRRLPVGSYGWSGAYGTHFWVDPQNEIVAIYMKNSRYDGGSGAVTAANFEEDVALSLQ